MQRASGKATLETERGPLHYQNLEYTRIKGLEEFTTRTGKYGSGNCFQREWEQTRDELPRVW